MAKLYYGNGECSIEGSKIRGVEIIYSGKIRLQKTTGDSFTLSHANNKILIYPNGVGFLSNLFEYNGILNIKSVTAGDVGANRVMCTIKKVMDYSELLNTNAEDMTNLSENLKSTNKSYKSITSVRNIIENLHTSEYKSVLANARNLQYSGYFHIHTDSARIMSGKKHSKNSEDLFIVPHFYIKANRDKLKDAKRISQLDSVRKFNNPRNTVNKKAVVDKKPIIASNNNGSGGSGGSY